MRVRDHVALSSTVAALAYPRLRRAVLVPWAASILIDVDHYLWFLVRHRRLSPAAAVDEFTSAAAPRHAATRSLHHPAVLLGLLLVGRRSRAASLVVTGMAFHVGLDTYHRRRSAGAQATALDRDQFRCRVCGVQNSDGVAVVAHLWRQPRLLPSYRSEHFVTVCGDCHAAAHAPGAVAITPLGGDWNSYRHGVLGRRAATR
jgi:hypothetical protein